MPTPTQGDAYLLGCMPFSRSLCSCQLLQAALQRRHWKSRLERLRCSRDSQELPPGWQLHGCAILVDCGLRRSPALICAQVYTVLGPSPATVLAARPACEEQDRP